MHWFDNFINRPIKKILRLDKEADHQFLQPIAIFLMFNDDNGFLMSTIIDGKSIQISSSALTEVYDEFGIEYGETVLNELRPDDKLNIFAGQAIRAIKAGRYSEEIKGDSFIINEAKYAGVTIQTEKNKFTFYNEFGGCVSVDEDVAFPNGESWTMMQNGT